VFGSGADVVLLKRLDAALADGDPIRAAARSTTTAPGKSATRRPSSDGQARAIALARAVAGVTADAISYVECHGTATPLGDPIEIGGLVKAFRATTDRSALIKTILALEHDCKSAQELPHRTLGDESSSRIRKTVPATGQPMAPAYRPAYPAAPGKSW
jgi:hypothetical protein